MQFQRPEFIQQQQLRMNAQLIQSIKLMELPIMELRERIEEEVEQNPALEVVKDRSVISLDEAYTPRKEEEAYFEGVSDSGFTRQGSDKDAEEWHQFIEGALSRPETLQEHLLWNLRLQPASGSVRRIGELLIQNLDADGFHKEPVELLLKDEDPGQIQQALELIRALDPVGTCVKDYRESLLVQARLLSGIPGDIEAILDYLGPLERGRVQEVARKLNRTGEEIARILERLRELHPFPGRQWAYEAPRYVVPDVQVIRKEGEFIIVLNQEEIPVLGINAFFTHISRAKDGEKPVRDFAKKNIRDARCFIQSIRQRNKTLLLVSKAVVEFQRSFFVKGPKYLAPLTLRDISRELGVHETTVSRTANGKYMQTEWGIFEIRYFFTNSISGTGTGRSHYSKEGVKEVIRELIAQEERRFSDQEIADLLARQGILLARRTVAKYRKELDLGSSYTR
ncbi:MAG: RNA polymerase factor sigma-54 [Treponema sp.]|nr:RNA polymerase factor sigma-54 [Treponema sp.]